MSCSKIPQIKIDIDRETFEKEYTAWMAQNNENYEFSYEYRSGSIGRVGPVSITIAENEEPVIENLGHSSLEDYPANNIKNISDIFNFINETFDHIEDIKNGYYKNSGKTVKSVSLMIKYNAQYHYPEKVSYGVSFAEKGIVGQPHYDLNITEFISK